MRLKRFLHDVSTKLPDAFEKLKSHLKVYDIDDAKRSLARLAVLVRLFTSIKDYAQHAIVELGLEGRDVFDYYFARQIAAYLAEETRTVHWAVCHRLAP